MKTKKRRYCRGIYCVAKKLKLVIREDQLTSNELTSILIGTEIVYKDDGEGDFFIIIDPSKGWVRDHWRRFDNSYGSAERARAAVKRIGKKIR